MTRDMTPTGTTVPREAPDTEQARFEKPAAAVRPTPEQAEPAPHAPQGLPEFMPLR